VIVLSEWANSEQGFLSWVLLARPLTPDIGLLLVQDHVSLHNSDSSTWR
jgi:hypothetical protein